MSALPVEVLEIDALRHQATNERAVRLAVQLKAIEQQRNQIADDLKAANDKFAKLSADIWGRYALGPSDGFDYDTLKIIRVPEVP